MVWGETMKRSGLIEIELLDGRHMLIDDDVQRIHDAVEKIRTKICFSRKFPFWKIVKVRYTEFQCRPAYESYNNDNDPVYTANCRLMQFMNLIGVDAKPFPYEQFKIEDDLHG